LQEREQTGEEKETPQPDSGDTLTDGDKVIQSILNGTHNEQLKMEEPEKTAAEPPVPPPQAQEIPPDYVPAYRTGDTVCLENDREFAIAAIYDSKIMLADASFPMLNRNNLYHRHRHHRR